MITEPPSLDEFAAAAGLSPEDAGWLLDLICDATGGSGWRCPGFTAWWLPGDMPGQPPPRYGARVETRGTRYRDPTYYVETPDQVVAEIEADRSR